MRNAVAKLSVLFVALARAGLLNGQQSPIAITDFLGDSSGCRMRPTEFPDSLLLIPDGRTVVGTIRGDSVYGISSPSTGNPVPIVIEEARCKEGTKLLTTLRVRSGTTQFAVKIDCGRMEPTCVYTGLGSISHGITNFLGFRNGHLVRSGFGRSDETLSVFGHPADRNVTSPIALFSTLATIPRKSEYESWAVYSERIHSRVSSRYYAVPVSCAGLGRSRTFNYDADARIMAADFASTWDHGVLQDPSLVVYCSETGRSSYVGTNAYGATARVTVKSSTEVAIRSAVGDSPHTFSFSWPMLPAEAQREQPHLRAILIIHPAAGDKIPLTETEAAGRTATFAYPIEERITRRVIGVDFAHLFIYSAATRRIYISQTLVP